MEKLKNFNNKLKVVLDRLEKIPSGTKHDEVSIPAYKHNNFFVRKLFADRLKIAHEMMIDNNPILLDYGCGSGLFLESISDEIKKGIGVDLDIDVAQQIIKSKNIEIKKIANSKEIESFPELDVITSFDVLEHVENLEETLGSFKKKLKKKGYLIISGPTENTFYKIGRKIANIGIKGNLKGSDEHVRTINDIENIIKKNGFSEMKKKNLWGLFHIIQYQIN